MMQLSELAAAVGGGLHGADVRFDSVSTDSRSLTPGALFIALQGPRFDGNSYVATAAAAGAVAALVSQPVDGLPFVRVDDTRWALGRLATVWRRQCSPQVVGVTGSNGKTSVKEMLAAILSAAGPTLSTQGNLNNDIGLPLTLLNLRAEHRYAVLEMGANHPGEIAYLAALAEPAVALINNAGAAHLQGFGSVDGVARAKGELLDALSADGVAVLNADDRFYPSWRERAGARRVISFGSAAHADVRVDVDSYRGHWLSDGFHSEFNLHIRDRAWPISLQLAGRHNAHNAAAAAAAALAAGADMVDVQAGLARLKPVTGRMQPLRSHHGAGVFNDTYNANPSSFAAALEVLADSPAERWVALGGFGELGDHAAALHADLGRTARRLGVTRLLATGPLADQAVAAFGEGATYFNTAEELIDVLNTALPASAVLLVKGSRSQRMERVVEALCAVEAH